MTIEELAAHVRIHTSRPECMIRLVAMCELAHGLIGTVDQDAEYTVYFDKSQYSMNRNSPYPDYGLDTPNFPQDVGYIYDVQADDWQFISAVAALCLESQTTITGVILFHDIPIPISVK